MIEEKTLNDIFHDYRDDVFKSKKLHWRKEYREKFDFFEAKWFEETNYLKKTLIYALTCSNVDVEFHETVKSTYSLYCANYESKYSTADLMNGWWYCFKTIYSRKEKLTRKLFREKYRFNIHKDNGCQNILDYIEDIASYIESQEEYDTLCAFLAIVYSAGNMTPAPINPSAQLDAWEFKQDRYKKLYKDPEYKQELLLMDYDSMLVFDKNDLKGYMESRIEKILKRSYRISKKAYKDEISKDEYEEMRNGLNHYIQNLEDKKLHNMVVT